MIPYYYKEGWQVPQSDSQRLSLWFLVREIFPSIPKLFFFTINSPQKGVKTYE
jgi:hypothetical protein